MNQPANFNEPRYARCIRPNPSLMGTDYRPIEVGDVIPWPVELPLVDGLVEYEPRLCASGRKSLVALIARIAQ